MHPDMARTTAGALQWAALPLRWVALAALYFAFAGQLSVAEVTVGLVAGLATAAFSLILREATERPLRLRAPWHRLVARLARSILRDVGRVAVALARAVTGHTATGRIRRARTARTRHVGMTLSQPLARIGAAAEEEAGHWALVILLASIAPNGYVLESRQWSLELHRLTRAPPAPDPQWPI
jgi:hypothetical protein